MSITSIVAHLVASGRLINRPSPLLGLDDGAREMFVTREVDAIARRPFGDTAEGERRAALAQFLDAFCEFNEITVCQDPFSKPPDVMLARVHPVEAEFWSLMITDPEGTAGIRILGAFCYRDGFVALTWDYRELIPDFGSEVENVQETWRAYFGLVVPHSGDRLDDYLSNHYEFR